MTSTLPSLTCVSLRASPMRTSGGGERGHGARQLFGLAREQARRVALAERALDEAPRGVGFLARNFDQDRREHEQERAADRLGFAFDLFAQADELAEDVRHVTRGIVVLAALGLGARALLDALERAGG